MTAQRKILAATDLSARCDRAVDRGVLLAREWSARFGVAHVFGENASNEADLESEIRAILPDPHMDADLLIGRGSVLEALHELVEQFGPDLILTGIARYNGVSDYLLGTAVDQIIRRSRIPVLVVKRRAHGHYRKMIVASDLSDCSRAATLRAAALFPNAEIKLVHAYHVPFGSRLDTPHMRAETTRMAEDELAAFMGHGELAPIASRMDVSVGYGETERVVSDRLKETQADLLVMGTHGRSGFVHATMGSMAESILSWASIDTLMVRQ